MFSKKEVEFIKNREWINEYISLGKEMVKSELILIIRKNKKSSGFKASKKLGLTDAGLIMLYAKILEKLEEGNNLDNCSIILKGYAYDLDLDAVKAEINRYLSINNGEYGCLKLDKVFNRVVINIEESGTEPYEDFNVDYSDWGDFTDKLTQKYGIDFSVPSDYWGK